MWWLWEGWWYHINIEDNNVWFSYAIIGIDDGFNIHALISVIDTDVDDVDIAAEANTNVDDDVDIYTETNTDVDDDIVVDTETYTDGDDDVDIDIDVNKDIDDDIVVGADASKDIGADNAKQRNLWWR